MAVLADVEVDVLVVEGRMAGELGALNRNDKIESGRSRSWRFSVLGSSTELLMASSPDASDLEAAEIDARET